MTQRFVNRLHQSKFFPREKKDEYIKGKQFTIQDDRLAITKNSLHTGLILRKISGIIEL